MKKARNIKEKNYEVETISLKNNDTGRGYCE